MTTIERKPMTEEEARNLFESSIDMCNQEWGSPHDLNELVRERDEALKIFDDLVEFKKRTNG